MATANAPQRYVTTQRAIIDLTQVAAMEHRGAAVYVTLRNDRVVAVDAPTQADADKLLTAYTTYLRAQS